MSKFFFVIWCYLLFVLYTLFTFLWHCFLFIIYALFIRRYLPDSNVIPMIYLIWWFVAKMNLTFELNFRLAYCETNSICVVYWMKHRCPESRFTCLSYSVNLDSPLLAKSSKFCRVLSKNDTNPLRKNWTRSDNCT